MPSTYRQSRQSPITQRTFERPFIFTTHIVHTTTAMSNILHEQVCVKLNKSWQAVGIVTPAQAITFLCSEHNGEKPGFALDFEVATDENGEQVIVYAQPVSWETWLKLPVRPGDRSINTSRGAIRLPLIVICARYNKVPTRTPRLSSGNIMARDGYICQRSGRKLPKHRLNIDHVQPLSRGGKNTWENMVTCDKEINTMKGDRLDEEVGLSLIRKPKAPKAMPVIIRKAEAPLPEQVPFLME